MELQQILAYGSDLIFEHTLLDFILSKKTFIEFFDAIYSFPDIYDNLSKDQDYWRKYMQKHYPVKYTILSKIRTKINWFYELISTTFSEMSKYYYITDEESLITQNIPNFTMLNSQETDNLEKIFHLQNEFNLQEMLLNLHKFKSFDSSSEETTKLSERQISSERNTLQKQVSSGEDNSLQKQVSFEELEKLLNHQAIKITFLEGDSSFHVLFSNGEVLYVQQIYTEESDKYIIKIVAHDIKKINEDVYSPFVIFLSNNGILYKHNNDDNYDNYELTRLILPFRVKDIQYNKDYYQFYSVIDNEDNLYLIDFRDKQKTDYTYITDDMLFIQNIRIKSHIVSKHDDKIDYINFDGVTYYRISILYIDSNDNLRMKTYKKYPTNTLEIHDINFNMKAITLYSKKYKTDKSYRGYPYREKVIFFVEDNQHHIYEIKTNRIVQYKLEINVKQFDIIEYNNKILLLVFVTDDFNTNFDSKLKLKLNLESENIENVESELESEHLDSRMEHLDSRMEHSDYLNNVQQGTRFYFYEYTAPNLRFFEVYNVDLDDVKYIDFPLYTRIFYSKIDAHSTQLVLSSPSKIDRIYFPYSLYLLYYLKGLIKNFIVRDEQIIFTMKDFNYIFQTTIPKE